jgi:hypothetical protein
LIAFSFDPLPGLELGSGALIPANFTSGGVFLKNIRATDKAKKKCSLDLRAIGDESACTQQPNPNVPF